MQQARSEPGEREAPARPGAREEAWRDVGLGAQILRDLGVTLDQAPRRRNRHYVGLSGFGIDITSTDILEG